MPHTTAAICWLVNAKTPRYCLRTRGFDLTATQITLARVCAPDGLLSGALLFGAHATDAGQHASIPIVGVDEQLAPNSHRAMPATPEKTEGEDVEGEAVHVFELRLPRPGNPGRAGRSELPFLIWQLGDAADEELRRSLRRVNLSTLRHGRPRLLRDGAELVVPTGGTDEESEEALALAEEPGDRGTLAALTAECDRERKRLQTMREQTALEMETQRTMLARHQEHTQTICTRLDTHLLAMMESYFALEAAQQNQRIQSFEGFAAQASSVQSARTVIDGLLTHDRWADMLANGRELVAQIIDSPLGRMLAAQISANISARLSTKAGDPISEDDVLLMTVRASKAFHDRVQQLRGWAKTTDDPRAAAADSALSFILDELEFEEAFGG